MEPGCWPALVFTTEHKQKARDRNPPPLCHVEGRRSLCRREAPRLPVPAAPQWTKPGGAPPSLPCGTPPIQAASNHSFEPCPPIRASAASR